MKKENRDFLEKYFNGGASKQTLKGEHLFAQNLLLKEIAKHLAPDIITSGKLKVSYEKPKHSNRHSRK